MIEPLQLKPKLDSRLWGGARLAPWLGLADAPAPLAEVWQIDAANPIAGGSWEGQTLEQVTHALGPRLVGTRSFERHGAQFPLLTKLIDARDDLSVQVHPDDARAAELEGAARFGKTEAWYFLQGDAGAEVLHGFNRDTSPEEIRTRALDGSVVEVLRRVPVVEGEALLVSAGTVHAIRGGTVLFEVQQRSDLTYRLFDYGRLERDGRPRPLHLDKALRALKFEREVSSTVRLEGDAALVSPHFRMRRWDVAGVRSESTDPATFLILAVLDGPVNLVWAEGALSLPRGGSVLLPAALGAFRLEAGRGAVLACDVPAR